jgi:hypothetical protein
MIIIETYTSAWTRRAAARSESVALPGRAGLSEPAELYPAPVARVFAGRHHTASRFGRTSKARCSALNRDNNASVTFTSSSIVEMFCDC